jgi:hypothetical protein
VHSLIFSLNFFSVILLKVFYITFQWPFVGGTADQPKHSWLVLDAVTYEFLQIWYNFEIMQTLSRLC